MRRYRKSTGKESMRASRTRPNLSLIQMQNAGTAMGMMAASGVRQGSLVQRAQRQTSGQRPRFTSGQARNAGVRQGSLVQRAQRQTSGQRPRFTSGQARNAGVAMGMMAATGQRDTEGFFGRLRTNFDSLKDMALSGDTGAKEFDDIR
jgi:hypothetical protein